VHLRATEVADDRRSATSPGEPSSNHGGEEKLRLSAIRYRDRKKIERVITLGGYRRHASGLWVPHTTTSRRGRRTQTMRVDTLQIK